MSQSPARKSARPRVENLEGRVLMATRALSPVAPIALSIAVAPESDRDGNGLTVARRVTIRGTTEPGAVVRLFHEDGRAGSLAVRANARGSFRVVALLEIGTTTLDAVARLGRRTGVAEIEVTRADAVLNWNNTLLAAIRREGSPPPIASRALAMVHTAVYDAVNSITPTATPIVVSLRAPRGTSSEIAASEAAYQMAVSLFPNQKGLFDAARAEVAASVPGPRGRLLGERLGQAIASAVLASRAGDGSTVSTTFPAGNEPGAWVPTAPSFAPALLPQWPLVTPFVVPDVVALRPSAPPALSSAQYAAELAEVQALGARDSTTRTADQTAIARFWGDGAGTFTPPGHWNQVAETAALNRGDSLAANARLFAQLNVALADAAICCWDAKYAYALWRPITAIREADADGNPATIADPTWTPLLATPPFPAYTSGHSTFSAAAADILTAHFGDHYAFTDPGDPSIALAPRTFASFRQAAEEAGQSRIYGGIHFQSDNQNGLAAGRQIGRMVLSTVAV